jgi:hypothetical protein
VKYAACTLLNTLLRDQRVAFKNPLLNEDPDGNRRRKQLCTGSCSNKHTRGGPVKNLLDAVQALTERVRERPPSSFWEGWRNEGRRGHRTTARDLLQYEEQLRADNSRTEKHAVHSYLLYQQLLKRTKETAKNVLEVGIYNGESVYEAKNKNTLCTLLLAGTSPTENILHLIPPAPQPWAIVR